MSLSLNMEHKTHVPGSVSIAEFTYSEPIHLNNNLHVWYQRVHLAATGSLLNDLNVVTGDTACLRCSDVHLFVRTYVFWFQIVVACIENAMCTYSSYRWGYIQRFTLQNCYFCFITRGIYVYDQKKRSQSELVRVEDMYVQLKQCLN